MKYLVRVGGVLVGMLVMLLGGCQTAAPPTTEAPWAEQLRIATAAATAQDPAAVIAGIEAKALVTETLDPAMVLVITTFRTSDTTTMFFKHRSTDPDATIAYESTQIGAAPSGLTPPMIATIQQSPIAVLQTTWDEGQRYLAGIATESDFPVRVELATNTPAHPGLPVVPPDLSRPVAWKVTYTAITQSPIRAHMLVFWVDPTSGDVLFQEEISRP